MKFIGLLLTCLLMTPFSFATEPVSTETVLNYVCGCESLYNFRTAKLYWLVKGLDLPDTFEEFSSKSEKYGGGIVKKINAPLIRGDSTVMVSSGHKDLTITFSSFGIFDDKTTANQFQQALISYPGEIGFVYDVYAGSNFSYPDVITTGLDSRTKNGVKVILFDENKILSLNEFIDSFKKMTVPAGEVIPSVCLNSREMIIKEHLEEGGNINFRDVDKHCQ